ncbi:uncharacterized protein C2orf42 [Lycorma delicatula]|uniref:uncharacterized protein C2orf42 n=1 Tax=Lycorma delicatula TaxID=130591 RepID=UPI003F516590
MPNDEKLKALLADLGKSTLRGVKKCPKCGTYNGTRGLSCKNKACDVVFKEAGEKRKQTTEVCKLITGNSTQIFSVRIRDKGPDYRGFVQLPVIQPNVIDAEAALITQTTALCFVETCQRTFTTKILRCHEKDIPVMSSCQHIHAALRCCTGAQPLAIVDVALNSLNISSQMKQTIWQLRSESCGPLVQRVSKNIMAVKCKVNAKHPVGYLHVSFFVSKSNSKESQVHYTCSCPAYKMKNSSKNEDGIKADPLRRCVHYYACVAAFAGDAKLSEEFSAVLDMERPPKDSIVDLEIPNSKESVEAVEEVVEGVEEEDEDENGRRQLVAILGNVVDACEVEVEVLPEEASSILQQYSLSDDLAQLQGLEVIQSMEAAAASEQLVTDSSHMVLVNQKSLNQLLISDLQQQPIIKSGANGGSVKRKRDDATSALLTLQEGVSFPKKTTAQRQKVNQQKSIAVAEGNETTVYQSFIQWLASVTERINQAMHYQFDGKPAPLVFHAPQAFFDCLRERISVVGPRKRLPNQTVVFNRKDSVPLGTFTKYSWHINNIFHCKQIFETPLMPLHITRSFIENQDGTYDPYDSNTVDDAFSKTENTPRIKPLEHKTFLKVGNTTRDQMTPTPFIIEWMPDVLPISHVGELRLVFEYGHLKPC